MSHWKRGPGALLALMLFAAPASAQTTTSSTALAAPDLAALQPIQSQVSAIRGLAARSQPEVQVLDHAALHRSLVDEFERDYLPAERESDQKELTMLGLIQPTDDLVQLQLDLLDEQVVGVYEPDARSLFIVGDHGLFGSAEKITYAHEFNHALQDQYFDLRSLMPKHADSNDRSLAVHAIVEGDAVMLQTLWAQRNLSRAELLSLAQAGAGSDAGLARVPSIVRAELLFPYTEGFNFVRQTYRDASGDYTAVDALFSHPPESTAQVLHPDKYRARVHPLAVHLPDLANQLGTSWRRVGGGVLGELDTRVLLEQGGTNHADALRVASGWSGDGWQLVERDGQPAIVVRSTWESIAAGRDFFDTYASGLRSRFAAADVDEASLSRQALSSPSGVTDLRLQGTEVVAVIARDRDTANAVMDAVTAFAAS